MASGKEYLRHCILFAFQLKKNAVEKTEMIFSAFGEGVVTHKTCKKWFQRFRNDDFDLSDRESSGQPKKFEDEKLEQLLEKNPTQMEKIPAHACTHCSFYIILLNRTKKEPNKFVDLIII